MASTEDLLKKQYGTLLSIDRHIERKATTVLLTSPDTGNIVIGLISFVSGLPTTKYFNLDGSPYTGSEPIPTVKTARRLIGSELLSVSASSATLTVPSFADYAEVYVKNVACIWGFYDSIAYPIDALANTKIVLESEGELNAFEIRSGSNTTVIVNYFKK